MGAECAKIYYSYTDENRISKARIALEIAIIIILVTLITDS
jgi:hypothetical protein